MFVGVDGCQGGWLAVRINEAGTWGVEVYTNFAELWERCQDASLILVDIPIGLQEQGREERHCDKAARRLLGPKRGCSVFPAPCRPALSSRTFTEAGDLNERMTGRRLAQQTWAILPKIKQVDDLPSCLPGKSRGGGPGRRPFCIWQFPGSRPGRFGGAIPS